MTENDSIPPFADFDPTPGVGGRLTRADVVACARSWIGSPYVHGHRMKNVAVDCAGLVIGVARELQIVAPDFDVNGYERAPDGKRLLEECDRFMTRIPMHALQPGDVLVVRFEKDPQHMGIVGDYMVGQLSLIHALGQSDGRGKVVEWGMTRPRKGWMPIQAYCMPGVS